MNHCAASRPSRYAINCRNRASSLYYASIFVSFAFRAGGREPFFGCDGIRSPFLAFLTLLELIKWLCFTAREMVLWGMFSHNEKAWEGFIVLLNITQRILGTIFHYVRNTQQLHLSYHIQLHKFHFKPHPFRISLAHQQWPNSAAHAHFLALSEKS